MIIAVTSSTVEFALSLLTLATLWQASSKATEREWSEAALWVLTSLEPALLLLAFHGAVRWVTS